MINNDQDWLDLRIGDQATVRGLLEHISHDGVVIGFSDWSQLSIEGMGAQVLRPLQDKIIDVGCTRTEDGLMMSPADIRDAHEVNSVLVK